MPEMIAVPGYFSAMNGNEQGPAAVRGALFVNLRENALLRAIRPISR
ncbi:hypothetical protein [Streptomyces diastatochromogenes]